MIRIQSHLEDAHAVLGVAQQVVEGLLEALEVVVVHVGGGVDGPVDLEVGKQVWREGMPQQVNVGT